MKRRRRRRIEGRGSLPLHERKWEEGIKPSETYNREEAVNYPTYLSKIESISKVGKVRMAGSNLGPSFQCKKERAACLHDFLSPSNI